MSRPAVSLTIDDRAAWLTIDRAERRNTIVPEVIDQMAEHLDRIEADDRLRVICLTGAGEEAFCSGMDLKAAAKADHPPAAGRDYLDLLRRILEFPKPFIARINGDCTGGGLGLMSACDLVYAVDRARFGAPEARLGLFPLIMVPLIMRKASRLQALEMFYTTRLYPAVEAARMGLITRALPAGEFDYFVRKTVKLVAGHSPTAIKIGRVALARAESMDLDAAMAFLSDRLDELLASQDAAEGIRAFVEKRPPRWTGA